jgi:hypothetical protein
VSWAMFDRVSWTPKLRPSEASSCEPPEPVCNVGDKSADCRLCATDDCTADTLVDGLSQYPNWYGSFASRVTIHEDLVYFSSQDIHAADEVAQGSVFRVPAKGGEPETMAAGFSDVSTLLVRHDFLYFGAVLAGEEHMGIQRVPVAKGEPELVIEGRAHTIVADDENAYFAGGPSFDMSGNIYMENLGGGGWSYDPLFTTDASGLWLDGKQLIFRAGATFYLADARAREAKPLYVDPLHWATPWDSPPYALVFDEGSYYFSAADGVHRLDKVTNESELLAPGEVVCDMTLAGDYLYFSVRSTRGSIRRIPKRGGPVVEIASDEANPCTLAADATHLYWLSAGRPDKHEGRLRRMPL